VSRVGDSLVTIDTRGNIRMFVLPSQTEIQMRASFYETISEIVVLSQVGYERLGKWKIDKSRGSE